MPRCAGFKPDGSPCERIVEASATYCYSHDPARKGQRSRAASTAARSKTHRLDAGLLSIKAQLQELADKVLDGTVARADAAVVGQLLGTYVRVVAVEMKVKEVLELEGRVAALENEARRGYAWPR